MPHLHFQAQPPGRLTKPLNYGVRHLLALALAFTTSACFDSDDLSADPDLPATSTRGPKPHPPVFETGDTEDDGPIQDIPDPDETCADAVGCILECADELQGVTNPDEVDLSCFFDCAQGLTVEEALLLVELGTCVFDACTTNGSCEATPDNPLAPLDPDGPCILCIGLGIGGANANICEEELLACD